jgi:aldehyde dehydrogenase (NAD+)
MISDQSHESAASVLAAFDLDGLSGPLSSVNPSTGEAIASLPVATSDDYERTMTQALRAFEAWRLVPAPQRGEIVRQIGEEIRTYKNDLGTLISLEMGKIRSEGLGEAQEVVDICDFAVGLSRTMAGLTLHSERPQHRMYEQWHPLGVVGVITAFNFPMAVWSWNAMLAAVCGDVVVWKPSPKTPLCALAVQKLVERVMTRHNLPNVFNVVIGGNDLGERLVQDRRVPLISFTGSVTTGRTVAAQCAQRLGRSLLELGGNNGVVVMDDANLELAMRAIMFSAVGTTGQRCTTARRLFLHRKISEPLITRLQKAYSTLKLGDPLDEGVLVGPLVDASAVAAYERAIAAARAEGATVVCGGRRLDRKGFFVEPTLIRSAQPLQISREETFAPIAYLVEFDTLDEAIAMHNAVSQGLSSSIFTTSLQSAERFLSATGSDCGIANVNIGTSGAEIGGAFGGEKDTGGGRESGSDSWKAYMRRQTCTINYGDALPLAQGVKFDV